MKNKQAVAKRNKMPATQNHLTIGEIKSDSVVMKDGTMRAVVMTSSINFALKTEDEQNAMVGNYVNFLNSLDHPLQIVIQCRKLNIKPYLDKLLEHERAQANDLLRTQIADYRSFIANLVDMGNIMSKNFLVVVPYDPLSNKRRSFWSRFTEVIYPAVTVKMKEDRFLKRKEELDTRVRLVEAGLSGMGLEVVRLDTQSLIELYYSTYNPDIFLSEPLPDIAQLRTEE